MKKYIYYNFIVIALVTIADFAIPGKVKTEHILNLHRNTEQYYNAAQNSHYSYKIITSEDEFSVESDFAKLDLENKIITYSVSRVFQEVNWYKLESTEDKQQHSLRLVSGLVLPLLALIAIVADYRFKRNIDILVFVLQVLLLGNLIFLLV